MRRVAETQGGVKRCFWGIGAIVIVGMSVPLLIVLIMSFHPGNDLIFPPSGISLRWYLNILKHPVFLSSFRFSLILGTLTTLVSLVIGLSSALVLTRRTFRGSEAISSLLMSPLIVPQVVIGMSFLTLFSLLRIYQSVPSLIILHIILTLPYTLRVFIANLSRCPLSLEEAAMVMGASQYRAFIEVTLPTIKPGIAAAAIFSFVTSFDNVTSSQFLVWDQTTLSGLLILMTVGLALAIDRWIGLETITG
jgi:putative spermidine/putrescine transport system permease protein